MTSVLERILHHNSGRDAGLLEKKLSALESDPFVFFRGTCHLFWENWKEMGPARAPVVWCSGDLHIENFGSYKGDNRLVYFDINDFDEALLAPATGEITRLAASVIVGSRSMLIDPVDALDLARACVKAYAETLVEGHAHSVETRTARGLIREFLDSTEERTRRKFLNKRTKAKRTRRRFRLDGEKYLEVDRPRRDDVKALMADLSAREGDFFDFHDVARRVAGTGSLGLERYAIVVEGRGFPDENFILDLKEITASSGEKFVGTLQPKWRSEGERVVEVQKRMQITSPAFLREISFQGKSFVLKELQPSQDKMDLASRVGKIKRFEKVITTMGRILAWNQLRSGGRQGSAIADELIDFGRDPVWQGRAVDHARAFADQVARDHTQFRLERGRG